MNHFTIRDIENLCGIKAHTLRIWEQRYKLFVAKRKQSQHRIYDNEDLKELLRISFLYHNGHKISKIAKLNTGEIRQLVESSCIKDDNHETFVHQLVEAGVGFDKEKFEKLANCLVLRFGLEKSIVNVFYPFLQRIGLLWMTNNVIPAQEHFVSHIIRKKIILATDGLEVDSKAPADIVVFAPFGEYHEIPLLTANYFFRKYNNRTAYFGVNVSPDSLKYYLENHQVTCLYTHLITKIRNDESGSSIISLCRQFPDKKIIVSGPACECVGEHPANLRVLHSLEEMISFAKETGAVTLVSHNS
ncbi:MAG: MerR family transcriptional regulator [Chitinophagaceae bacterium]